ncbi:MAG: hypothetical protein RLY31_2985, partial [Bacteroidota bacterium]
VIMVEVVHFVQYGILATLVFSLLPRYGPTLLVCILAACLDESWQHFVLSPEKSAYLDFNDLLLDGLGAGLSLVWLRTRNIVWVIRTASPYRFSVAGTLLVLALSAAAHLAGVLHYHDPSNPDTLRWSMVRQPWEGWWHTVHPNVTFHIVRPMEGLLWLTLLFLVVRTLDADQPNG